MARKSTKYIIIHCSATPPSQNITRRDIDIWHRKQGWLEIGYHFVIQRDGTLEKGRDIEAAGAHCKGYNSQSLGICMVGGVNENDHTKAEDNFTEKQWPVLKTLVLDLMKKYPTAQVVGHYLFANKACPSFDVQAWWKSIAFAIDSVPAQDLGQSNDGFEQWLIDLLKQEGGYAKVKGDSGGETYAGITRKSWPQWPGWPLIDEAKPLARDAKVGGTEKLVRDFYYNNYWRTYADLTHTPRLKKKLANMAVHMGGYQANKLLQMTLNAELSPAPSLSEDGIIGVNTRAALKRVAGDEERFLDELIAQQNYWYVYKTKNGQKQEFLEGWIKRGLYRPL